MEANPNVWYGDSYIDAHPKTWALQQLGLGFTKAIVKHILAADARIQDPSASSYYKQRRRLNRFAAIQLDDDVPTPTTRITTNVPNTGTERVISPQAIPEIDDNLSIATSHSDDVRTLANLGLLS